jgi:hypothetical protein
MGVSDEHTDEEDEDRDMFLTRVGGGKIKLLSRDLILW